MRNSRALARQYEKKKIDDAAQLCNDQENNYVLWCRPTRGIGEGHYLFIY